MTPFDAYIALDWSGADGRYAGVSVASCAPGTGAPRLVAPEPARWTRSAVADWLDRELRTGRRLLIGLDFAFGMPTEPGGYLGTAAAPGGIFALWDLIDAAAENAPDFGCGGIVAAPPFAPLYWRAGKRPASWLARQRLSEIACAAATGTRPECVFKLIGPKQVGKASLTGMRVLRHIRRRHAGRVAVWPYEPIGTKSVLVEIYPTLFRKRAAGGLAKLRTRADLNAALKRQGSAAVRTADLSDHDTDALISAAGLRHFMATLSYRLDPPADARISREGWIFGVPLPDDTRPPSLILPRKGGGKPRHVRSSSNPSLLLDGGERGGGD
ncbi:MAG TPA: hypothetical protein VGB82_16000 [Alphaproteobacteria bacterium]